MQNFLTTDDVYKNPREAAAYLRTSTSTLAKRRLYGTGPAYCRIGRAIRYRTADLDSYMTESMARSTSDEVQS